MKHGMRFTMLGILCLFMLFHASNRIAQMKPDKVTIMVGSDRRLESEIKSGAVTLHHNFFFDDTRDHYQCQGATGSTWAIMGDWLGYVRVNTDDGWGGCVQQFAMLDPLSRYPGLRVSINFVPTSGADAGQCGGEGSRDIDIRATQVTWTPPMRINTDSRPGHCNQTWTVAGRDDVGVEIIFYPDDEGKDQCMNAAYPDKPHLAKLGQPVTIGLNTDNNYGGCQLSYRLRRLP